MKEYFEVLSKLAFVLLVVWLVLAGLGLTTAPHKQKRCGGGRRRYMRGIYGDKWAVPVSEATWPESELAFPQAEVF